MKETTLLHLDTTVISLALVTSENPVLDLAMLNPEECSLFNITIYFHANMHLRINLLPPCPIWRCCGMH